MVGWSFVTWMMNDSKLSVSLLYLQLRRSGGHPQGSVVGIINDHISCSKFSEILAHASNHDLSLAAYCVNASRNKVV